MIRYLWMTWSIGGCGEWRRNGPFGPDFFVFMNFFCFDNCWHPQPLGLAPPGIYHCRICRKAMLEKFFSFWHISRINKWFSILIYHVIWKLIPIAKLSLPEVRDSSKTLAFRNWMQFIDMSARFRRLRGRPNRAIFNAVSGNNEPYKY